MLFSLVFGDIFVSGFVYQYFVIHGDAEFSRIAGNLIIFGRTVAKYTGSYCSELLNKLLRCSRLCGGVFFAAPCVVIDLYTGLRDSFTKALHCILLIFVTGAFCLSCSSQTLLVNMKMTFFVSAVYTAN